LVLLYSSIDIFFAKSLELVIHHFFSLGILCYNNYYNVDYNDSISLIYYIYRTEISSIFLVLKYWINYNAYTYPIVILNNILFYLTFFKFRIIDYYYNVISPSSTLYLVFDKYSQNNPFTTTILAVSVYGLYFMNIYWFLILNKIICKSILKNSYLNTDKICHFICSYIHYLQILLCVYMYSYSNNNEQNMFDTIGIIILSVTSHLYHYSMYFKEDTICDNSYTIYPCENNYVFFINDNAAINIRSFLTVVTNYYNSKYLYNVISLSFVMHATGFYHSMINLIQLLISTNEKNNKNSFFLVNNIVTIIPIGFDICVIFMNSPNEIAIPFMITNVAIGLLIMVEPFYKLTHVGFHSLLLVQTYYLCLSNSVSHI